MQEVGPELGNHVTACEINLLEGGYRAINGGAVRSIGAAKCCPPPDPSALAAGSRERQVGVPPLGHT